MRKLRHAAPAFRVYAGDDSLQQLATELDRIGARRAVVFCGRTIAGHPHGLSLVADALGARYAGAFADVKAHSPIPNVLAGADALRELQADAVIAVGGGSAVVTARASTIVLAEGGDVNALCTQFPPGKPPVSPRLGKPKLPQLVVPSTPTTAYAKAGSAVVDPARDQRLALFDPKTRAGAIFIHPSVALTASPGLTIGAAVNAFCMAVQGLESRSRDPLADALLTHALRLLAHNLRRLAREPDDADVRAELMLGALLAGQGTDYAPTGVTSAVSHAIGARFHLDNGITNGVLLPHTMRFNAGQARERLALVAHTLGAQASGPPESDAIDAVERLFGDLALPRTLRDIGVSEDALPTIAEDVFADWFLRQNPRPIEDKAEILELLKAAW